MRSEHDRREDRRGRSAVPADRTAPDTRAGLAEIQRSRGVSIAQVLALQQAVGNGAVSRAVRDGAVRPARARIARLAKNPFEDPAHWADWRGAAAGIEAYLKLSKGARRKFVRETYKRDLVRVLLALSPVHKVHKYNAAIMEITRFVEEEETRASAGMTDDQMASVQQKWMKKQAEDAAKAAALSKTPPGGPAPPPPTAADVEDERKKHVESTSIPPAGPSSWGTMTKPVRAAWTTRALAAIRSVVALAKAKHPVLKLTASKFRVAFEDVETRGAGVLAFGEPDYAGGTRAAIGFDFVTAAERNPAYVMDIVVHELYGHPGYGEYGTEYHLGLYDRAMTKMPGYTKPAEGTPARTSELDAYAYQETEIYSFLRSMPYRTAPKAADVGLVPDLDTQMIVDYRVGLMKDQWAPALIVPILRGFRMRLVIDPRIPASALKVIDQAVLTNFDAATVAKVKKP